MTRKELAELKFDAENKIFVGQEYPCAFDDESGMPIPTTIGRTWKTTLIMKIGGMIRLSEKEYTPCELLVVGRPRGYEYQICESFPFTEQGFETAKRFMLTGKKTK